MDFRHPRGRILLIAVLAALWMGAALGRLAYLQLACYSDYLSRAEHQQRLIVEVSPSRGDILDRNLRPLAMSVPADTCFAVPSEITDPAMVAQLLSGPLNLPEDEIESRLAASRTYARLARKLSPDIVSRIEALNLKGIYFEKEDQRFYPKRELAASVLGYVDVDQKGLGGIEYSLDDRISSQGSRMAVLADAHRHALDSSDKAPATAGSVVLTLDQNIQYIAERELNVAIEQTHAISGTVIVENPSTGELLAVANYPTFNPNAAGASPVESRMDRGISALYEPGSVFKVVTVSAVIDQGLTRPDEVIDCQNGAIYIAGHRIRDHKAYGDLTVAQILAYSSDVGAIKLGLRLGAPKFYQYITAYGFGQATGVDLPGESKGMLRRIENWTPVSVGSISMGQEIGVTPLQILTAMSAIANGGMIVQPHVVDGLRNGNGPLVPETQPEPRRVIQATTAATMRQMLEGVILKGGTGPLARLDGYTAGGKTGTAQKFDPATGRYSTSQYIASFVGFAPLNNPAIAVLVQLDSPVGPHEGGEVAAPVFHRVAQQVLEYLNVPHDVPMDTRNQVELAQNRGVQQDSLADGADFDPANAAIDDSAAPEAKASDQPATINAPSASTTSVRVSPSAPQHAESPTIAAPQTVEIDEESGVQVPNMVGETVRDVTEQCQHLGLVPVLAGGGVAVAQSPPAGSSVRRGSRVNIQFGRAAGPGPVAAHGSAHSPGGDR
ncbi:MAG: penicillin-binding protein [Candidatus Acidiferrales bacterium]|jgi:cell division protein FtsI (penicillin-binding protein 3)